MLPFQAALNLARGRCTLAAESFTKKKALSLPKSLATRFFDLMGEEAERAPRLARRRRRIQDFHQVRPCATLELVQFQLSLWKGVLAPLLCVPSRAAGGRIACSGNFSRAP